MDKKEYLYCSAEILDDGTCHAGRAEISSGSKRVDVMGQFMFQGISIYFLCFELVIGFKTYL